jgi:deazaflavin-dependent oxidoreductase (nitroreductase family)
MPQLIAIVAALILGIATIGIGFVLGWRAKSPLVLGPIIWFSKRVVNPRQLRSAGTPGAYAAIIRNRGRVSGKEYETPVAVVPTGDGFLIALPYGSRAQWLRNVLASGSATIVNEGRTYEVSQPELISTASVMDQFPASDQRSFRLLGVDGCLRVRAVTALDPAA